MWWSLAVLVASRAAEALTPWVLRTEATAGSRRRCRVATVVVDPWQKLVLVSSKRKAAVFGF